MPDVLVLVEHDGARVHKSTYELLTAARRLGDPVAVLVGAPGTAARLRESLARYGATRVYAAESTEAESSSARPP